MTNIIPTPNVSIVNGQPATTSLAIAEHFGKRHCDVLRDIRKLMDELPEDLRERNFAFTFRTVAGPNNSQRQEEFFTVFFDGFILLVMGYTGKRALQIKLVYIAAFNTMREQLAGRTEAPALEPTLTPSTPDDRKPLRSLVFAWSKAMGVHVDTCWPQVKAYFQITRIDDLPLEWIPDALAFVQSKIDALPRALPAAEPAPLPPAIPAPATYDASLEGKVRELRGLTFQIKEVATEIYTLADRRMGDVNKRPSRLGSAEYSLALKTHRCMSALHYSLDYMVDGILENARVMNLMATLNGK